ncbi:hypothetical protein [Desulfosporosinus sp.]|uniref:hypothetical protein n=1 Tax=Desulfosporosinus sp. TaxID=157907 RepID=UPI0025BE5D21|nr:hypothetical protein [Desulfosporosinus sp.]MBC2728682.1 hypothetical protein [Desulfosporosinus sp.]
MRCTVSGVGRLTEVCLRKDPVLVTLRPWLGSWERKSGRRPIVWAASYDCG